MTSNAEIAAVLSSRPLAIEEASLHRIVARLKAAPTITVPLEAAMSRPRPASARREDVAVIPLTGFLAWRPDPIETFFLGATSVSEFVATLRSIAADPKVGRIILDVDSPGGSVDGITEAAAAVRQVARSKPVVAVANTLMASAAYWIGSQAGQVIASPSAMVGSIGVYGTWIGESRALDRLGFDVEIFSAGRFKAEGHPARPLTDPARQHLQESVDDSYFDFIGDVATGRSTTRTAVRTGYGEGRALTARPARAANLVDRIDTLESVLGASTASGRFAFEQGRRQRVAAGLSKPNRYEQERARRAARTVTGGTR